MFTFYSCKNNVDNTGECVRMYRSERYGGFMTSLLRGDRLTNASFLTGKVGSALLLAIDRGNRPANQYSPARTSGSASTTLPVRLRMLVLSNSLFC